MVSDGDEGEDKMVKSAREEKNWEESDRLRDKINELGYNIKDTKNGTEIARKN